ncbi:MAG: hypothetical protein ACRC1K_12030, partial [Planctomycetia bacterium]
VPEMHRVKVLSKPLTVADNITMEVGTYRYVTSGVPRPEFRGFTTLSTGQMPTLVRSNVRFVGDTFFGKVFGMSNYTYNTTAVAIHRPRDIAVVMDLSVSMRFGSMTGTTTASGNDGALGRGLNNDRRVPKFGHYSAANADPNTERQFYGTSNYIRPDSSEVYGLSNLTAESSPGAGDAIIDDFLRAPTVTPPGVEPGGTKTSAFGAGLAVPGDGKPNSGDDFLRRNLNAPGLPYAASLYEVLFSITNSDATTTLDNQRATRRTGANAHANSALWEASGYDLPLVGGTPDGFKGFTQGPGHWGKSFWVWPPDPRPAKDWRRLYFTYPGGANPIDYNNRLYEGTGRWRQANSTATNAYDVDYDAVLAWIKADPCPFPNYLRCGRTVYYTDLQGVSLAGMRYSDRPTDNNRQFWKEYIDFVICTRGLDAGGNDWAGEKLGNPAGGSTAHMGSGADFDFGTQAGGTFIRALPTTSNNGGHPATYMDYRDNPKRPQAHFWFGGYTMIDFVQRRFGYPGNCHEAQNWQLKVGVQSAIRNIEENYPNDQVSLIYFSGPSNFQQPQTPMGTDFDRLVDSLFHPRSTLDSKATIYGYGSENFANGNVPRALGSTCPSMGMLLAFNQCSSNSSLLSRQSPEGTFGGKGRRGAQKTVVLLTDGAPNGHASGAFQNLANSDSYYENFTGGGTAMGAPEAFNAAINVTAQLVALESAGGYSASSRKAKVHGVAFGDLFDASLTGGTLTPRAITALNFLQQLEVAGNTAKATFPPSKIITGTVAQRVERIEDAFGSIMQDGIQVTLIE